METSLTRSKGGRFCCFVGYFVSSRISSPSCQTAMTFCWAAAMVEDLHSSRIGVTLPLRLGGLGAVKVATRGSLASWADCIRMVHQAPHRGPHHD